MTERQGDFRHRQSGLRYHLNNREIGIGADADLTRRLLDVLRLDFGLTGTKEGCGEGECGACLVWIDDRLQNACLVPLGNVVGKRVVTIEAFAETEEYQRIASAFLRHGAVQCGYCTPGMVMAVADLLRRTPQPDLEAVKAGLAGNLCRCTGYQTIFEATLDLAQQAALDLALQATLEVSRDDDSQ